MIIIYKRILSLCKHLLNFYNHYLINFIYPFPFGSLGRALLGSCSSGRLCRYATRFRLAAPLKKG